MPDIHPNMRRLGEQMMEFTRQIMDYMLTQDDVLRQVATEKYRQEVEAAARAGCEHWLAWHTLGIWTEDGKSRIGCFSRALEGLAKDRKAEPATTPREEWSYAHSTAECLYEIGRVHAAEGSRAVAKDFYERALPHARAAEDVREAAGASDPQLEGKIASALLLLDADE